MVFHGIDLHHDSLIDSIMQDTDLNNITQRKYYLQGSSFETFRKTLRKDDYVVFESCSNAFWLYDQIHDLVKECYIVNTMKIQGTVNKTDKIDSKRLVKRLSYFVLNNGNEDDLPTVFVPAREIRELRGLFTTSEIQKKQIVQTKNRIYSILRENGIQLPKEKLFRKKSRSEVAALQLSNIWKYQLMMLYDELAHLEEKHEELKKVIQDVGSKLFPREVELLISIRGISILTAVAIMTDVVDIHRFSGSKKFCAYLRTAPKVKSSNMTTKLLGVNKQSRVLTLNYLSQSVLHFEKIEGYPGIFYARLRQGKKASVCRMALMRKILVSVYHMLKNDSLFYWTDQKNYLFKLNELRRSQGKELNLA